MGRPRKWPRKENKCKSDSGSPPSLTTSPISSACSDMSSSSDSDAERLIKLERTMMAPTSAGFGSMMPQFNLAKDKRTRSGCNSCKLRRKKCDESYPKCTDCARLGLKCERAPASRLGDSQLLMPYLGQQYSYDPTEMGIATPPSIFPCGTTREEKTLFLHYADVVTRSLSVVPDEINPFLNLFIPMAFEQSAMRFALLGLSASHLRRVHPQFEPVMTQYLATAMEKTRELLCEAETSDDAAVEALGTILVLCLHEICEGKSKKWQLHLNAAIALINSKNGQVFPPAVRFLLEATAYFDSVATLSYSAPPLLEDSYYPDMQQQDGSAMILQQPHQHTPHALFGTASELFAIISDISRLAQRQSEFASEGFSQQAFIADAAAINERLMIWRPIEVVAPSTDVFLKEKLNAAATAVQWAAIMRLHQLVEGYDKTHPKVQLAVRNILDSVAKIPFGDLAESILVFPMLMAGVGAYEPEDKAAVRQRLSIMGRMIGFGNVYEALELVERVWKLEEEAPAGVDPSLCNGVPWDVMMRENGETLIMS